SRRSRRRPAATPSSSPSTSCRPTRAPTSTSSSAAAARPCRASRTEATGRLHAGEVAPVGGVEQAQAGGDVERHRVAAGARVVEGHHRDLVVEEIVDAEFPDGVGDPGALPEIEERRLEAVEAAGDAEPGGEAV